MGRLVWEFYQGELQDINITELIEVQKYEKINWG